MGDNHFLSAENPLATVDQREIEDRALRLMETPVVKKARAVTETLWRNAMTWPRRDQMNRFDNAMNEFMFHYVIRAANGDPAYPKIMRLMAPPHRWFGRDVFGSRWGGDSPDFIYRLIPIEHGGHYEIRGRATCAVRPLTTFTFMGDIKAQVLSMNLLDSLDMTFNPDGTFVVTIDDQPANGRPNHIQTTPGVDRLFVRDALGDWMTQSAHALQVRRVDTPKRGALTEDDLAALGADMALNGFYYTYYTTQSGAGQPPNDIRLPQSAAIFGGMASQRGSKGNLLLEPDEALVVHSNDAGAQFRNVTLTDAFHNSFDYWTHTTSFNMVQMAPDADGRFTFVVAHEDPGVHNWIDTRGMREPIFGCRWQAFRRDATNEAPFMTTRKVKFKDLPATLAKGVKQIDAAGRKAQVALREAGYKRRFVDK